MIEFDDRIFQMGGWNHHLDEEVSMKLSSFTRRYKRQNDEYIYDFLLTFHSYPWGRFSIWEYLVKCAGEPPNNPTVSLQLYSIACSCWNWLQKNTVKLLMADFRKRLRLVENINLHGFWIDSCEKYLYL